MKTKIGLGALLALAAVAGCATAATEAPRGHIQRQRLESYTAAVCTSSKCAVEVVAAEDCKVEVRPYYLIVVGKQPATLTWTLSGKGARFVGDGVFYKEPDARKFFERDGAASNAAVTTYTNRKTNGLYHYGVKVAVGDRECPVLDPGTVNDMDGDGP